MSADTRKSNPRTPGVGLVVVACLFSLSAVAAFGVQTYFAYGFARHVWGLPALLSWGPPVGLDLFIATLMAATYLLRAEPKKDLRTLWALTGVGILLQVAAAEAYAQWLRHPYAASLGVARSLAALAPALMLAAILHTLIKVRRVYTGRQSGPRVMLAAPHWPPMDEKRARALAAARGAAMAGPQPEPPRKPPRVPKARRATAPTGRRGRPAVELPTPGMDLATIMTRWRVGERRARQLLAQASRSVPADTGGEADMSASAAGAASDAPVSIGG
jgi:hypothetical protein